jgi:hypothetical protein
VPPSALAWVSVERGVERLLRGHGDIVPPGGSRRYRLLANAQDKNAADGRRALKASCWPSTRCSLERRVLLHSWRCLRRPSQGMVTVLVATNNLHRDKPTRAYRGDGELTRLRDSAVRGDVQSAWDVCQLYHGIPPDSFRGRRVAQDDAVAVEWYRRAATRGHLRASGTLAAIYYTGRGVPHDFAQALHWNQPPAAAGMSEAQYLLGLMYANGQGVQRDESQAFSWFFKSAAAMVSIFRAVRRLW